MHGASISTPATSKRLDADLRDNLRQREASESGSRSAPGRPGHAKCSRRGSRRPRRRRLSRHHPTAARSHRRHQHRGHQHRRLRQSPKAPRPRANLGARHPSADTSASATRAGRTRPIRSSAERATAMKRASPLTCDPVTQACLRFATSASPAEPCGSRSTAPPQISSSGDAPARARAAPPASSTLADL